jgi:hypothetical protein
MAQEQKTPLKKTRQSLERMQNFDSKTLPRVDVLGTAINFAGAIEPANHLIDLYKQLFPDALDQLPESALKKSRTSPIMISIY